MWFILENILQVLKKNVYSASIEWNGLYIFVGSIWCIVLFKPAVSFFSVWVMYLLKKVGVVVPYIIVLLSLSLQFC